ncbi:hypothetical protein GCM10022245_20660 [Streptomyces mayteni]
MAAEVAVVVAAAVVPDKAPGGARPRPDAPERSGEANQRSNRGAATGDGGPRQRDVAFTTWLRS